MRSRLIYGLGNNLKLIRRLSRELGFYIVLLSMVMVFAKITFAEYEAKTAQFSLTEVLAVIAAAAFSAANLWELRFARKVAATPILIADVEGPALLNISIVNAGLAPASFVECTIWEADADGTFCPLETLAKQALVGAGEKVSVGQLAADYVSMVNKRLLSISYRVPSGTRDASTFLFGPRESGQPRPDGSVMALEIAYNLKLWDFKRTIQREFDRNQWRALGGIWKVVTATRFPRLQLLIVGRFGAEIRRHELQLVPLDDVSQVKLQLEQVLAFERNRLLNEQ
ncbi:MAG: hypothetical protein MUF00_16810 [Gemmatimonadaceae bacterium]|jgi:hypothetical protein|nr:hypothetical protein [Gemmatimonadaceae bacterium]